MAKLILASLAIFMLSACDSLDEVKKLKENVEYYKNLSIKANKEIEKYKDEIENAKERIKNLNIDLEKAKSEIKRTKELHKKMLE